MLFNKNIVLEILRSVFSNEIGSYIEICIAKLDEYDYENFFELPVDFADFHSIDEITVESFSVEKEDGGESETVSGILEIAVCIDGFEDDFFVDSAIVNFEMGFSFYASEGRYSDLELEYLY